MKTNRKQTWTLLAVLGFLLLLPACKIPTSMAGSIAGEAIGAWKNAGSTTQTSKIWPDKTSRPADVYKVKYYDRKLFSAAQAFRYDLLAPPAQKGFAQGAVVGSFWMRLPKNQGLMKISGLGNFDEGRSRELLTRVIRENLRIMDYDLSRIEYQEQKAVQITSTPQPWDNKYFFQTISISDPTTKAVKHIQEIDQKGHIGQVWEVTEYAPNLVHEKAIYAQPQAAQNEPTLNINVAQGTVWKGEKINGQTPLVYPNRKAVHRIHSGPLGNVLVSDYSDGLNVLFVVQYSGAAPAFEVPWSRKQKNGSKNVRICLISASLFASFSEAGIQGFVLAQENAHLVLDLVDGLATPSE